MPERGLETLKKARQYVHYLSVTGKGGPQLDDVVRTVGNTVRPDLFWTWRFDIGYPPYMFVKNSC